MHRSVFVRGLLNLPKRSTTGVKFYFGVSLHIFSMVRHCLWKMCGTPGACINETGLFSSAAVVPQGKSTELCSWAVVAPHKVNLTELCSNSTAVVPQSISTEVGSSAAPFLLDLSYLRHRTNKHISSMLFIQKNL